MSTEPGPRDTENPENPDAPDLPAGLAAGTDEIAPDADPDEVEPAFDVDLDPEDQGRADAGAEPTG